MWERMYSFYLGFCSAVNLLIFVSPVETYFVCYIVLILILSSYTLLQPTCLRNKKHCSFPQLHIVSEVLQVSSKYKERLESPTVTLLSVQLRRETGVQPHNCIAFSRHLEHSTMKRIACPPLALKWGGEKENCPGFEFCMTSERSTASHNLWTLGHMCPFCQNTDINERRS